MAESNFLTKQVAGQPMGVWIAVVLGGLGIAWYINRNQGANDAQREPVTEPGVGTGLVPAGSAIQPGSSTGNGDDDEQQFENNTQWGNAAKNWLIGQGTNPTTADQAIRKYLVAEQLSASENALIALVLSASGLGVPPGDLPPSPDPEDSNRGEPRIEVNYPSPVQGGDRPQFQGSLRYGGGPASNAVEQPVTSPQTVTVKIYSPNLAGLVPNNVYQFKTDSNGKWTFSAPPNDRNNTRTYVFSWEGRSTRRTIKFV